MHSHIRTVTAAAVVPDVGNRNKEPRLPLRAEKAGAEEVPLPPQDPGSVTTLAVSSEGVQYPV